MLNTLKRKIALVAVSAVGMSGLALMSAPAANAAITGISAVATVPQRASSTTNTVSVVITSTSDTTQANNIVVGETVSIAGRVLSAPTPAAADSLTTIAAGDSIGASNAYLPTGAASAAISLVASKGNDSSAGSGPYSNNFTTAGTYSVLLWVENGTANGAIDGGEAAFTAAITIGGAPTTFAISKTAATTAGTADATVAITLKDGSGNATLFKSLGESLTAVATIAALSTETLTVKNGTVTTAGSGATKATASRNNGGTAAPVFAVSSGDSITASTGAYNLAFSHTAATSSTVSFNFGGDLVPVVAQTFTLTTTAVTGVTKVEFTNASGLTTNANKYTAPVAIETATAVGTVVASTTGATSVGIKLTGTAGGIVNVVISGSTVTGVSSGTYPVTLGADGTSTYTFAGTSPVAGNSYAVSISHLNGTLTATTFTISYAAPAVNVAALGSNGISTSILSSTVTSMIVKTGAKTDLEVTVADQFGTPKQYYAVTGALSAASRNAAVTITTGVTDANGKATLSLTDASTSTTVLSDVLTIQVTQAGVVGDKLNAGNTLTITYSATGAYGSLTLTGGNTATVTVTKEIESTTAGDLSAVNVTTSLKNTLEQTVSGVSLVVTGTDGLVFRKEIGKLTRPTTGDVKTITIASGESFTVLAQKPGTHIVTVAGGGLTATQTFVVSPAKLATARNIAGAATAGRVTATVKDGWGNPVSGVTVSFAADSKGVFGNGVTSTSAVTDASGTAAALVQSSDGTGADVAVIVSFTGSQSAAVADDNVTGFAAAVASATVTAKPTAGAASTDTAITAVKTDVATANAAVKALATQVTVLQASVATLIDSLTTQIASLMKSVSALTKAVAKLQTATKKK